MINRNLAKDVILRGIQVIAKQGITLLIFFISASILSSYEFGVYNFLLAIIYIFIVFGDFGISQAVSKIIAEEREKKEAKIGDIISNSFIIITLITIISLIILLFLNKQIFGEFSAYSYYIIPLIFLIPASSLLDGIYRGEERFMRLSVTTVIVGIITVPAMMILIKLYGIKGAILSLVLFNLMMTLSLMIGIRKVKFSYDKQLIKNISRDSLIIGLGSIGLYLYTKVDLIFLGYFGFIKEVAYYEIINKIQVIFLTPFLVIAQVIGPRITRLYARGFRAEVIKRLNKTIIYSIISGLIICLTIFLFKKSLFEALLPGYATTEMYSILNIMLIVYFTQILTSIIPVGFTISTGHAKISMIILLIFGFLNVVLDFVLISVMGFIGVIYATVICKVSADLFFLGLYKKKLRCQDR